MDILGKVKKIIWNIFPPESNIERAIRTQYHRFTSTKLFVHWKIYQSKKSYKSWLRKQEKNEIGEEKIFPLKPIFSFFLSLNVLDLDSCIKTIGSIQSQSLESWELILFSSKNLPDENKISQLIGHNQRIKLFVEEVTCLRRFFELSKGDYFICCSPGDTFEKGLIYELVQKISTLSNAEIIYTDVDIQKYKRTRPLAFFKPEKYSPELHLSVNYLSSALVKKNSALNQIEKVNSGYDFLLQEWELMFLLCEKHSEVSHIPLVLVHQYRPMVENRDQVKSLMEAHFQRVRNPHSIQIIQGDEVHLRWKSSEPSVSIVIPSKNHYLILKKLIDSLFAPTIYKNFGVVIVDNNSEDNELLSYYAKITNEYPIQVIHFNEEFNY